MRRTSFAENLGGENETLEIPDDFYIVPTEAAWLLNVSVRELTELQDTGKLEDVILTPGHHRRYNMCEVLQVRAERMEVELP